MTQDQCLDNDHRATSNNDSTNDQVSDEQNKSKNSSVSNGVNSVQEFNVDVNSKQSGHSVADVPIVQNCVVDANGPSERKVFKTTTTTSNHSADTSRDFVDSKEHSKDNIVVAIDVNKIENANNNISLDMTVITHQNSNENIRDIIANSDQVNKIPSDSQLTEVVKNNNSNNDSILIGKNPVNSKNSVNKTDTINKKINLSKCEQNLGDETDKTEDPIERLNKLRASISNALSEVKGVLKQYSTDGENESNPSSKQPSDDGPVRFRFVRKIRRRSVFSEDDNESIVQNTEQSQEVKPEGTSSSTNSIKTNDAADQIQVASQASEQLESLFDKQKDIDEVAKIPKENCEASSKQIQGDRTKEPAKRDESIVKSIDDVLPTPEAKVIIEQQKIHQKVREDSISIQSLTVEGKDPANRDNHLTEELEQNDSSKALYETEGLCKTTKQTHSNSNSSEVKSSVKIKSDKSKKLIKKDRRASIAAVEINQVPTDKPSQQLELKTQRRPSDSGTLVKQSLQIKSKITEKQKLSAQRQGKIPEVIKSEAPHVTESNSVDNLISREDLKTVATTKTKESVPSKASHHENVSTTQKTVLPVTAEVACESKALSKTDEVKTVGIKKSKESFPSKAKHVEKMSTTPKTVPSVTTEVALETQTALNQENIKLVAIKESIELLPSKVHQAQNISNTPKLVPPVTAESVNESHTVTAVLNQEDVKTIAPKETQESIQSNSNLSIATHVTTITYRSFPEPTVNVDDSSKTLSIAGTSSQEDVKTTPSKNSQGSDQGNTHSTVPIPSETTSKASATEPTLKVKAVGVTKLVNAASRREDFKASASKKSQKSVQSNVQGNTSVAETPGKAKGILTKNVKAALNTDDMKTVSSKKSQEPVHNKVTLPLIKTTSNTPAVEPPVKVELNSATEIANASETVLPKHEPSPSTTPANVPPADKSQTECVPSQTEIDSSTKTPEVSTESESPEILDISMNDTAAESNPAEQECVVQRLWFEEEPTEPEAPEVSPIANPKKKRKAKRKVVIRRIKRKLSKEDTFIQIQEAPSELEIEEKEIEENDGDEESEEESEIVPKQRKSCLKARQFEIGDIVMYAERFRKTQVKWRKAKVIERITSISYKLDIEGEQKPAHISYIKKYTDRKVNFGGKEYLEIDYAQIEEDEEKERNYSIWNMV